MNHRWRLQAGIARAISAVHGHGVADLLDVVVEKMPLNGLDEEELERQERALERIAIVGKPNVGKSMLFNKLIGENRSIVDNAAGTTRDTILYKHVRGGKTYNFIDTAGLRRPDRERRVEQA
ncbi:hypothetical protein MASR1M12_42380 [Erysipelotrichia bacterium]